jgi:uncharacterized protein YjbI with pentapeptide repeats
VAKMKAYVAAEGAPQSGAKMFLIQSLKRAFVAVLISIALLAGQGSLAPATPAYGLTINGLNIGPGANLVNADLKGANLKSVNLSGADLRGADLSRANLSYANLANADLSSANLTSANFQLARATGANFTGANLTSAKFRSATLARTNFTRANLTEAIFYLAEIEGIVLKDAILDESSSGVKSGTPLELPSSEWRFIKGWFVGPRANLSTADLSGQDLSGASLQGAILQYCNLKGTNFTGANLSGAYFAFSLLQNAILVNANLQAAKLGEVRLDGADASGANMKGAELSYSRLVGTNLTRADLTNADVSDADFTNANLSDSKTAGITGTPSELPEGWFMAEGVILKRLFPIGAAALAGESRLGQLLTVESTWESSVILTYKWMRNGSPIEGANQATYRPGTLDFGKTLTVSVSATKPGHELIEQTLDVPELQIGSLSKSPNPKVNGAFKVGQTLTAVPGNWEDGVTLNYLWIRDGALLANPSNSSSYTLTAADLGKRISLQVTGSLAGFTTVNRVSVASKVLVGSMTPTTTKISGTAKSGSTLKVTTSTWVKGSKITYQWLSNGAVIKGATSSSFKLTTAYKGKKISVKVTQAATGYTTAVKTSASVSVSK